MNHLLRCWLRAAVLEAAPQEWPQIPFKHHKVKKNHTQGMYPLVIQQFAIENGPVEIVDLPINNGDFPSFFVCLPAGKQNFKCGFNRNPLRADLLAACQSLAWSRMTSFRCVSNVSGKHSR